MITRKQKWLLKKWKEYLTGQNSFPNCVKLSFVIYQSFIFSSNHSFFFNNYSFSSDLHLSSCIIDSNQYTIELVAYFLNQYRIHNFGRNAIDSIAFFTQCRIKHLKVYHFYETNEGKIEPELYGEKWIIKLNIQVQWLWDSHLNY